MIYVHQDGVEAADRMLGVESSISGGEHCKEVAVDEP